MTLRSYHSILYARLGGASSARSDEQPGAGVDLNRVQRERGPVQLWRPAPTHSARRALHCPHRGAQDMSLPAFDSCPGRCRTSLGLRPEDSRPLSHPRRCPQSNHTHRSSRLRPGRSHPVWLTLSTQARLVPSPRAGAEPPIRVSTSRSRGDRTPARGFCSPPRCDVRLRHLSARRVPGALASPKQAW